MDAESVGALFGAGGIIVAFVLFVLAVIMPYSVYAAQKYAHQCFKEFQKINRKLDRLDSGTR